MKSSYTQKLRRWVRKKEAERPRKDKNIVAFLAARADVKAALEEGYAARTIWEHMHETGKIAYSYRTFLNHVRHYLREAEPQKEADKKPSPSAEKKTHLKEFTFNPTPKTEELF